MYVPVDSTVGGQSKRSASRDLGQKNPILLVSSKAQREVGSLRNRAVRNEDNGKTFEVREGLLRAKAGEIA